MASRAGAAPDWRAAFRRSFRRATHMAGAGILFALLVFLTLALEIGRASCRERV